VWRDASDNLELVPMRNTVKHSVIYRHSPHQRIPLPQISSVEIENPAIVIAENNRLCLDFGNYLLLCRILFFVPNFSVVLSEHIQ
jgi:hypothetical protein